MITCEQLAELLCDFCGDELEPEFCAAIREHLVFCLPCVHFVTTYQVTIQVTRNLPTPPLPEHLARKLQALLEQAQHE